MGNFFVNFVSLSPYYNRPNHAVWYRWVAVSFGPLLCSFRSLLCLITCFMFLFFVLWLFHSLFVLPSTLCVLCFCIALCVVSPYVYSCFFSVFKRTDHWHRVETQLQLINIISYHSISYHISCSLGYILWFVYCFLSAVYVIVSWKMGYERYGYGCPLPAKVARAFA
jgi:hypothetical protein